MNDSFNLIAQSRYYLKRFVSLLNDLNKIDFNEKDYALREMSLLIQESIELCIKGLVEILVGIDYKHTHLIVDNTSVLRDNSDNIEGFNSLKQILDRIDMNAGRICDFHTKAVYIDSFVTSEKELCVYLEIAKELHSWIDNNIKIKED